MTLQRKNSKELLINGQPRWCRFRRFSSKLLVAIGIFGTIAVITVNTSVSQTVHRDLSADRAADWPEECLCDGEMMCHRTWIDKNLTLRDRGIRFPCELTRYLKEFEISASRRSKVQLTVQDIVFVTYANWNHFNESREFILNITKEFPKNRIVYYDLGLLPVQVRELESQCRVEYRKFDYNKYPPHVKDLATYAFKPAIVGEAYKEFELFWLLDSSVRLARNPNTEEFVKSMWNETIPSYCTPSRSSYTTTQLTHFGMFRYLPTTKFRSNNGQFQAGVALIMRSRFASEVVKWYYLCGLTKLCIAPIGSFFQCETKNKQIIPNCHRFDQSALNIVVRNLLDESEYRHWRKDLGHKFGSVIAVRREHKRTQPLEPTTCK